MTVEFPTIPLGGRHRFMVISLSFCQTVTDVRFYVLKVGTLIDERFRVGKRLGDGMSGETYSAMDELRGHHVAVKIQVREPQTTSEFRRDGRERIGHEVAMYRRLAGVTGIPRLRGKGKHGNRRYIATQLIDGITLATLNERITPAYPDTVASVLAQLCEILDQFHVRHFVHRDVKPANIMIDGDGVLWLIDLGLVTTACKRIEIPTGTPPYIPPEQYQETWITDAADIYAAGVVLFEMATGSAPYADHDGPPEDGVDPFPDGLRGCMPPWLRDLGFAMITCDPQARPTSAAVLETLRPYLPTPGSPQNPKAPDPDPAARYRRSPRTA